MSRSRIILLLLMVLCMAVIYAWIATPRERRVAPGQGFTREVESQRDDVTVSTFPAVADLDFSGDEDHPYQGLEKNLFGPLYPSPKQIKPRVVPPAPKVAKPVVKAQKVVPAVIASPGPKSIQPFDVLGYLNRGSDTTVFLSSQQGEIYLVKTGDMFAADLVVRSVSDREIVIARRHTDQQVVLRLGKAKSQRLPKVKFRSDRPEFKLPQQEPPDKPTPGAESGSASKKAEK